MANRRKMKGFSIIEVLMSIAVMGIMVGASVLQIQPMIQQWHADSAMGVVLQQLRWARQASVSERRNILVQFIGNNELRLTRVEVPLGQTVVSDLTLTGNVQFLLTPAMPDTPDGFGNAGPIEFGGAIGGPPIMEFQSDGTLVDGNGNPVNGTVFLGITNAPATARAITVLGATGRVRTFKGTGAAWIR